MHPRHPALLRSAGLSLLLLAPFAVSCRDADKLTAPSALAAKKTGGGGGGAVSVSSVVPSSSERGVTLDVTVNGSGFEQASVVRFERQGVPATDITVNATTYVTARKVVANVTIPAGADVGAYDVAVILPGDRKGVGIEMFEVLYELAELGIIGGTWSRAHAINDRGEVVGESCTANCLATAFYWTQAGGMEDLGTLPGYSRSGAFAITEGGQIFGRLECRAADPGCSGQSRTQLVRWDRGADGWTITPVGGCSVVSLLSDNSHRFLVNDNDQCVGRRELQPYVQTLSGGTVVSERVLPPLYAGGSSFVYGMSDAPMVAGISYENRDLITETGFRAGQAKPVVWYLDAAGAWASLALDFPAADITARASDVSEPDMLGHVRVTGYTEYRSSSGRDHQIRAVRWTLHPDGAGGWRVASTEILASISQTGREIHGWPGAVNDAGDIVGVSGAYSMEGMPVKWAVGSSLEALPVMGGGSFGRAVDINNSGWIVGAVWDSKNNCDRAAIWRRP